MVIYSLSVEISLLWRLFCAAHVRKFKLETRSVFSSSRRSTGLGQTAAENSNEPCLSVRCVWQAQRCWWLAGRGLVSGCSRMRLPRNGGCIIWLRSTTLPVAMACAGSTARECTDTLLLYYMLPSRLMWHDTTARAAALELNCPDK
jgi:hypothetical protein